MFMKKSENLFLALFYFRKEKNMKINWKLRLKNKVTLMAIIGSIITMFFQTAKGLQLNLLVTESDINNIVIIVINMLVMLGVVIDPTTKGINDSEKALDFIEPRTDELTYIRDRLSQQEIDEIISRMDLENKITDGIGDKGDK